MIKNIEKIYVFDFEKFILEDEFKEKWDMYIAFKKQKEEYEFKSNFCFFYTNPRVSGPEKYSFFEHKENNSNNSKTVVEIVNSSYIFDSFDINDFFKFISISWDFKRIHNLYKTLFFVSEYEKNIKKIREWENRFNFFMDIFRNSRETYYCEHNKMANYPFEIYYWAKSEKEIQFNIYNVFTNNNFKLKKNKNFMYWILLGESYYESYFFDKDYIACFFKKVYMSYFQTELILRIFEKINHRAFNTPQEYNNFISSEIDDLIFLMQENENFFLDVRKNKFNSKYEKASTNNSQRMALFFKRKQNFLKAKNKIKQMCKKHMENYIAPSQTICIKKEFEFLNEIFKIFTVFSPYLDFKKIQDKLNLKIFSQNFCLIEPFLPVIDFSNIPVIKSDIICRQEINLYRKNENYIENSFRTTFLIKNHCLCDDMQKYDQKIFIGPIGSGKSHLMEKITKNHEIQKAVFSPAYSHNNFWGNEHNNKHSPGFFTEYYAKSFIEFVKMYSNAINYQDTDEYRNITGYKKQFLIIEEINRGDTMKILGSFPNLMDRNENGFSSYPSSINISLREYLNEYTNKYLDDLKIDKKMLYEFMYECCGNDFRNIIKIEDDKWSFQNISLLPNMSILATMNSFDKSIGYIDNMLLRRFQIEYVSHLNGTEERKISIIGNDNKIYSWNHILEICNNYIKKYYNEQKCISLNFLSKIDMIKYNGEDYITEEAFRHKFLYFLYFQVLTESYSREKQGKKIFEIDFYEMNKMPIDKLYELIEDKLSLEKKENTIKEKKDSMNISEYNVIRKNFKFGLEK